MEITIKDNDKSETITTDGVILLYLENDNIRTSGKVRLKALTPLIYKIMMDKMMDKMSG